MRLRKSNEKISIQRIPMCWKELEKFLMTYEKSADIGIKLIEIAIALFIAGILTNQLVHPLFSPRVSNIEVEPMFIQSSQEKYYIISRVLYEFEVPLFPIVGNNTIKIELPYNNYRDCVNEIEVNTNLKEISPYLTVEPFRNRSVPDYVSISEISITINTSAWSNKIVKQSFYVRERLENLDSGFGDLSQSHYPWSTCLRLSPILECRVVSSSNYSRIAYLETSSNETFSLLSRTFKNNCDLDIKGFRPRIELVNYRVICDKENELNEMRDNRISFDLKVGETKTIYIMDRETEKDIIKEGGMPSIVYNYSTDSCFWLWKTVREIGSY